MGFKKDTTPVMDKPAEIPTQAAQVAERKEAQTSVMRKEYSADESKVRGQVRMHAVIAGYKVASSLAPTLANTSASIKDELHKLAVEVAAKIEAYSFMEDK